MGRLASARPPPGMGTMNPASSSVFSRCTALHGLKSWASNRPGSSARRSRVMPERAQMKGAVLPELEPVREAEMRPENVEAEATAPPATPAVRVTGPLPATVAVASLGWRELMATPPPCSCGDPCPASSSLRLNSRVAAMPSMTGMSMSMNTRSYGVVCINSKAAWPLAASSTGALTSELTTRHMSRRSVDMSSTTSTRMGRRRSGRWAASAGEMNSLVTPPPPPPEAVAVGGAACACPPPKPLPRPALHAKAGDPDRSCSIRWGDASGGAGVGV
mmetsp:Transcript_7410/g.23370  ORF Transcript_7410/g.23370 Transcript_7410/m.23370 type:complete len:275 (+) Transcript_7410:211-1035(+)